MAKRRCRNRSNDLIHGGKWWSKVKLLLFELLWKHKGSGDMAPLIPNVGSIWRWVVSFTTRSLYPQGMYQRCLLNRRKGGLQGQFGPYVEKENFLLLLDIEFWFLMSCDLCRRWPTPSILLYSAYMAYVYKLRVLVICEGYHVIIIDSISVNRRVWDRERSIGR